VLKQNRCYDGTIDGRSTATQEGLDKFVDTAGKKGKAKPARIELAKASVGDFETWLKDADSISGLCVPVAVAKPRPLAKPEKPEPVAKLRRRERDDPPPRRSVGGGGGGGGGAPIHGVK
jgi:hypothetical protein